jgi:hypothetical protein
VSLDDFARRAGLSFRDRDRLERAVTHRSFLNEHVEADEDNERLEFLGDAALDLLSAAALYRRFPDDDEGKLTRVRSVSNPSSPRASSGRSRPSSKRRRSLIPAAACRSGLKPSARRPLAIGPSPQAGQITPGSSSCRCWWGRRHWRKGAVTASRRRRNRRPPARSTNFKRCTILGAASHGTVKRGWTP